MIFNTNEGKKELIQNIKLLLYKYDNDIFNVIDYENDSIYEEPLLFAFFNSKRKNISLETILYGYINENIRPKKIKVKTDKYGRIYLPKIGWFITNCKNKTYELRLFNEFYELYFNNVKQKIKFEPIEFINGTNIELLKYPIELLEELYYDVDGNLIDVEIENITKTQRKNLNTAIKIIKELVTKHYNLIESATKKIVIFNVDTTLRNSFASLSAQGISFSNSYQTEYNEVFFIDDIAHQTGHLIFSTLTYKIQKFLKIDPGTIVEKLYLANNTTETRSIYVVFHALYTYYTTFICLNAFLDDKKNNYDRRTHEAMGRMFFYIGKCYQDIVLVENNEIKNIESIDDIFTESGKNIYLEIKNKYNEILKKWGARLKNFNMSNQPYNFTFSKFLELNPLNEKTI